MKMKLKVILAWLMCAMTCCTTMYAAENISVDLCGQALNVSLLNSNKYVAFQMDITLPNGMTAGELRCCNRLVPGDDVTINGEKVGTDFIISCNMVAENVLRVVAHNLGNNPIEGTYGDIISIGLLSLPESTSSVKVNDIRFVKEGSLQEVIFSDYSTSFTPADFEDAIAAPEAQTEQNGMSFNLQGMKVDGKARGIIIKDGKKTLF